MKDSYFTEMQKLVINFQVQGKSIQQIADELGLPEREIQKIAYTIEAKTELATRKYWKSRHYFYIIALSLSIIGLFVSIFKSIPKYDEQIFSKQIGNLEIMSNNINEFQDFITEQKKNLIAEQSTLNNLKLEKTKLEPLVESDRQVVQAIFLEQEKIQRTKVWNERAFGFFIGVIGSLIASIIYNYFPKAFKRKSLLKSSSLKT